LQRAAVTALPADGVVFQYDSRDIFAVAEVMLAGELQYRRDIYYVAFARLLEASA
jgi:hypothetical protein